MWVIGVALGVTCGLSFLLVIILALRVFLQDPLVFLLPQKPQHSKFQFNLETVDKKSQLVVRNVLCSFPVSILLGFVYIQWQSRGVNFYFNINCLLLIKPQSPSLKVYFSYWKITLTCKALLPPYLDAFYSPIHLHIPYLTTLQVIMFGVF